MDESRAHALAEELMLLRAKNGTVNQMSETEAMLIVAVGAMPAPLQLRGKADRVTEPMVQDVWWDLSEQGGKGLARRYVGLKDYDRFVGQRTDCEYGMGPRHGHIVAAIEMTGFGRQLVKDDTESTHPEKWQEVLDWCQHWLSEVMWPAYALINAAGRKVGT